MTTHYGLWRGKPLEQYTREELYAIISDIAAMMERDRKEHENDMKALAHYIP